MEKDYSSTPTTFRRGELTCDVGRLESGVAHLRGNNTEDLAFGLGIAHAKERGLQMEMARLAGEGRLSECLVANDETEVIDIFMRELGMYYESKKEVSQLSGTTKSYLEAYCAGVNFAWEHHGTPWEFKLTRHKPAPWRPEHTLLTARLMSYVGLAQTQEDVERLIIQAVRQGVDTAKLKNLFANDLKDLTSKRIEKLRSLKFLRGQLPIELKTLSYLPKLLASNNWVIAPSKTKTKKPIHCADPHLEVNRLPGVWFEMQAASPDNEYVGITMPGVPGLIMGRTRHLAYSFTYGFMDMVDFFIEEIRDQKAVTADGIRELNSRVEIIKRKGKNPIKIKIHETQCGVLEIPATNRIENGFYLSRAWTNHKGGMSETIESLLNAQQAKNVEDFCQQAARVAISCNWLVSDNMGQIAYQQSGRAPKRVGSGLVPLESWEKSNQWSGMIPPENLLHIKNPTQGYLCTANNDIKSKNEFRPLNLPMGPYRFNRIRDVLSGMQDIDIETMIGLQNDLFSTQAEQFLEIFDGEFPETPLGQSLKKWDFCYNTESVEATLFERFYHNLLIETFGDNFFGEKSMRHLLKQTTVVTDYYHLFDNILLSDDPDTLELWFGGEKGRLNLFQKCLSVTLSQSNSYQLLPWGETNKITMKHLFFQGKLPSILGFDYGPVGLPGCRATIVQGAVYRAHGRDSSFAPSWRMITDHSEDVVHTVLAGGISDRRFDPSYKSEIDNWLNGRYKRIPLSKI